MDYLFSAGGNDIQHFLKEQGPTSL